MRSPRVHGQTRGGSAAGVVAGLALTIGVGAAAQTPPPVDFRPAVAFRAGRAPSGLAAADFDNDGRLDLVVANQFADDISILIGDGAGGFAAPSNVMVGRIPQPVVVADLNGDDNQDVIVGTWGGYPGDQLRVLLGSGTGTFVQPRDVMVGEDPFFIAVADFDRDGALDLVASHKVNDGTWLHYGDGAGGFHRSTILRTGPAYDLAIGDFNADGLLDVAAASTDARMVLMLATRDRGFLPVSHPTATRPMGIVAADFNSDSILDLALSHREANVVSVLLGDGLGGFSDGGEIAVAARPTSVTTGDVNLDGYPDLVVPSGDTAAVSLLLGDGMGGFPVRTDVPVGAESLRAVLADFDGDGIVDIALSHGRNDTVSVLLNNAVPLRLADLVDRLSHRLPDPAVVTGKARRVARQLAKLSRRAARRLATGAEASGSKQTRLFRQARRSLEQLLAVARRAAAKGRLGVPLGPIESMVGAALERTAS